MINFCDKNTRKLITIYAHKRIFGRRQMFKKQRKKQEYWNELKLDIFFEIFQSWILTLTFYPNQPKTWQRIFSPLG